jgi:hypothetical protein
MQLAAFVQLERRGAKPRSQPTNTAPLFDTMAGTPGSDTARQETGAAGPGEILLIFAEGVPDNALSGESFDINHLHESQPDPG